MFQAKSVDNDLRERHYTYHSPNSALQYSRRYSAGNFQHDRSLLRNYFFELLYFTRIKSSPQTLKSVVTNQKSRIALQQCVRVFLFVLQTINFKVIR